MKDAKLARVHRQRAGMGARAGSGACPYGQGPGQPDAGDLRFCSHAGSSMNPILGELDLLEIQPYSDEPVRVGDIVLFTAPDGRERQIVHRVVCVTPAGIRTRGDNSPEADPWTLTLVQAPGPGTITGRVVAAWRGQRWRRIAGGMRGRVAMRLGRWQQMLDRRLSRLLRGPYHALARLNLAQRLLPNPFRPRVVVFRSVIGSQIRLFLGRLIVGQYDAQERRWHIRRPFRLLVREGELPTGNGDE